jgi:phospholipid transport system substrate-binding protein
MKSDNLYIRETDWMRVRFGFDQPRGDAEEMPERSSTLGTWLLGLMLLALFGLPSLLLAGTPLETVKTNVDSVLQVLRDPKLQGESGRKVKAEKVEGAADQLFDFVEFSKRTLGLNWNKFTIEQRKEFVRLFRSILRDAYINKITDYTNEQVNFIKEVPLSDTTSEVQAVVLTKTAQIPVTCRLIKRGDDWKVYDLVIEGVSMINNYRTQFREILANNPPEKMLEMLRTNPSTLKLTHQRPG